MKTSKTSLQNRNKLKVPYYMHSSMRGTYWRPCKILERHVDGIHCTIEFFDHNLQDNDQREIEFGILVWK